MERDPLEVWKAFEEDRLIEAAEEKAARQSRQPPSGQTHYEPTLRGGDTLPHHPLHVKEKPRTADAKPCGVGEDRAGLGWHLSQQSLGVRVSLGNTGTGESSFHL